MPIKQRLDFKDEPLFMMDGSAYIFRSFYANQNMSRSDGMPTNVLYMVLRMLLKILREESPRHFVFVLDGKGKNFRHRLYTEYKAHRMATPEPLSKQIPPLIEAIKSMGIPVTISADCEADDCIASLSKRFAAEKPVVIIGADKDLKQCLASNIAMWDPSSKEERITTLASFEAEQGFSPKYWPDYQAIVGDSSDNIPGVPGIGPKGANTLMREFKGLDDIFARMAAVPPNLRKKLEGHQEDALVSRELTRLKTDTCSGLGLNDLALTAPKQEELLAFLNEYELRNLAREISSMLRINGMAAGLAQNGQSASAPMTSGFEGNLFQTSFKVKVGGEAKNVGADAKNRANSPDLYANSPDLYGKSLGNSGDPFAGTTTPFGNPSGGANANLGSSDAGASAPFGKVAGGENTPFGKAAGASELNGNLTNSPATAATNASSDGKSHAAGSSGSASSSGKSFVESNTRPEAQGSLWGAGNSTPWASEQGNLLSSAQGNLWGAEQGSLLGEIFTSPAPQANIPQLKDALVLKNAKQLALIPLKDINGGKDENRLLVCDGEQEYICTINSAAGLRLSPGLVKIMAEKELIVPGFKQTCELYPALRELKLENVFDISLAAWLLSPEEYDYSFGKLLRRWGPEAQAYLEEQDKGMSSATADLTDLEQQGQGTGSGALALGGPEAQSTGTGSGALALAMAALMKERLASQKLSEVLHLTEMPLIPVMLEMQDVGLGIDLATFESFGKEVQGLLDGLTKKIYTAAGKDFNIRSSLQLGKILYDDLKLGKARKTAGGKNSTAQAALEKLEGTHEIIDLILEYRKLEKLRSTYLEPLPKLADKNCRLHTSFNQSSTATGRLSSSNPNLQNIPVRGPLGSRMRGCFTSAPANLLVSADYSQIELRVLAHLSQDPTLLDAFQKGEDIHSRTAALIFEVAADQITPDQRRGAKTINFGLIYGMGPQKLARDLGISINEAKIFIERYFERLGKLREYFDSIEESAKEYGYVCTMTGRRRYTPEIYSANQQLRSQARRQAVNTCIQGSAADIIKLAMLAAAGDAKLKSLNARLILQIHDELLLECPEASANEAGAQLASIMSLVKPGGITLDVPLLAEYGSGKRWSDAH